MFRAASRPGHGVSWYVLMAGLAVSGGPLRLETAIRMAATGLVLTALYKTSTLTLPRQLAALLTS